MSPAEISAALEKLRSLKRHPRDEEENRYLIERAKRLYEDRLGEQRRVIQNWISQFDATLNGQDPRAIRHARHEFQKALDSIDGSFRF